MLSLIRVISSTAVICLSAQITWNLKLSGVEIPITGQSLAVLIVAFFLTPKESVLTLGLYIILGGFGLPIFADGNSGWSVLKGKSGGYIYGFLAAAYFVSWRAGRLRKKELSSIVFYTILGTIIILFIGATHLSYHIGMSSAWKYGVLPFWKGALVKIMLGSLIVCLVDKYFGKNILKDVYSG